MPNSWKIAGSYFEACNCEVACPCVFTSPPTSGECTVLIAWHIDQGSFGEIDLEGLNAVLAAHSPGHMLQVGCGSVGLMRTASSAEADGPRPMHKTAARPESTLFIVSSLYCWAAWMHGRGHLAKIFNGSRTALLARKAKKPLKFALS